MNAAVTVLRGIAGMHVRSFAPLYGDVMRVAVEYGRDVVSVDLVAKSVVYQRVNIDLGLLGVEAASTDDGGVAMRLVLVRPLRDCTLDTLLENALNGKMRLLNEHPNVKLR